MVKAKYDIKKYVEHKVDFYYGLGVFHFEKKFSTKQNVMTEVWEDLVSRMMVCEERNLRKMGWRLGAGGTVRLLQY